MGVAGFQKRSVEAGPEAASSQARIWSYTFRLGQPVLGANTDPGALTLWLSSGEKRAQHGRTSLGVPNGLRGGVWPLHSGEGT